MKRVSKNKKGFTLIEMMLSIAIIMIISGLFVTLIVAIKNSYLSVYNADDSADYAMLFAQGFENSFLSCAQRSDLSSSVTYYVANSHLYKEVSGTPELVFSTTQNKVASQDGYIKDKWDIKMDYEWDSSKNSVKYTITIIDNYYAPGNVCCVYESYVGLPHFDNGSISVGTKTVGGASVPSITFTPS